MGWIVAALAAIGGAIGTGAVWLARRKRAVARPNDGAPTGGAPEVVVAPEGPRLDPALAHVATLTTPEALARAVLGGGDPAVRAAALDRLAAEHPDHPETRAGLALLAATPTRLHPRVATSLAGALERAAHPDRERALRGLARHADPVVAGRAASELAELGARGTSAAG